MTASIVIRKNATTRLKVDEKAASVNVAALQRLPGMDRERVIWRRKYSSLGKMYAALFPDREEGAR